MTDFMIESQGYMPITPTIPVYSDTQKPVEIAPINLSGVWTQQWQIVDLDAAELEAKAAAAAQVVKKAAQAQAALDLVALKGSNPSPNSPPALLARILLIEAVLGL